MISRFDLTAADLEGLYDIKITHLSGAGETRVQLYYSAPELVEGLAERHELPVTVDDAHKLPGAGIFRTASISTTRGDINVFAVGSRPVVLDGVGAVTAA